MKRITIKEIARQAGVSVGTVDRVLHNRGEVAEGTKNLVLKIAKEGNYTTNVFARNLKLNKIYQIAVILPLDNEYWKIQQQGIEQSAEEYEPLGMVLKFYPFDRSNQGSFLSKAALAIEDEPDAVILAPLMEREATDICARLKAKKIPFVFVDSNLEEVAPLAFIGQDSVQSGYLAARLLNYGFERGHEAWILKYTDFDRINKAIDERIEGFRNYYQEMGWEMSLIQELEVVDKDSISGLLDDVKGEALHIFVPNSRSYQIVDMAGDRLMKCKRRIIGYDLIKPNIKTLQDDAVDFIIDQNPNLQGNMSVQVLYKTLIASAAIKQYQFMPLEIVSKENLKFANSYFEEV
ncbi:LacI family DNA-binding transcriptional regulator [Reichenbachiella agarivorans]|uniref:LacI family DNA-binding transcriptional regulator n=1 Tax=Reichenbachiella agarivorans TaxID=2979464 RepID=A0ABY6CMX4_9BACT|nr:LacI family DNA-binding transcriptional regulator [Reichenbachiella agarivorans]UXP30703.1 LacI family DNA-binding transcriptional regulator [Reichenbachiella agarivorans]